MAGNKYFFAAIIGLALSGCEPLNRDLSPRYQAIRGTVFSERYMPAAYGWDSKYSFSINTEHGRTVFQVKDAELGKNHIDKESIDALIEPGTKVGVEIDSLRPSEQQVYTVTADRIKVLE